MFIIIPRVTAKKISLKKYTKGNEKRIKTVYNHNIKSIKQKKTVYRVNEGPKKKALRHAEK